MILDDCRHANLAKFGGQQSRQPLELRGASRDRGDLDDLLEQGAFGGALRRVGRLRMGNGRKRNQDRSKHRTHGYLPPL